MSGSRYLLIVLAMLFTACERKEPADKSTASGTLDLPQSPSLNFFVLSDWGYNGISTQLLVRDEMTLIAGITKPQFVLTCGDNFHYEGAESIDDPLWKKNFEDLYTSPSLAIPWYITLGNHDYWRSNPDVQVAYSQVSDRWTLPSRYYTFVKETGDGATVRFIILDTEDLIIRYRDLEEKPDLSDIPQYVWFEQTLGSASEDWIIVAGHYPVYSSCPVNKGEYDETAILIAPLLEKYQPDFYLCGHDHIFEHARGNYTTDHFVCGSGIYSSITGKTDNTLAAFSDLGFIYFNITRDQAELYIVTFDDRIRYNYVRRKQE